MAGESDAALFRVLGYAPEPADFSAEKENQLICFTSVLLA